MAHGTGTPLNDAAETAAIKRALGEHAHGVAITGPKSMVGHQLGAAGAVSGLAAVLAICDGIIPPTINLETRIRIAIWITRRSNRAGRTFVSPLRTASGLAGRTVSSPSRRSTVRC